MNSGRSNNYNANLSLNTSFSPKTSGSTGLTYSKFDSPGSDAGSSWSLTIFATVTHTF